MLSLPPRAQELRVGALQLQRSVHLKGADWAVPSVLTLGAVTAIWYFMSDGIAGPFLLYLAILPVCLVLCGLRFGHEKDISVALMCEMLLTGAVVAITIASILEAFSQQATLPIWKCQKTLMFTWQCDAMFGLIVTICVGLSEEFAKFFSISRLRRRIRYVPFTSHEWWFRLVETPYALCLAGCASAAGFACIENIKYIITTGRKDIQHGIDTSLFRACLAIPFHIACTGWACARLSREWFFVPSQAENVEPPVVHTLDWLRQRLFQADALLPQNDEYHSVAASSNPDMIYKGITIWKYIKILAVPVCFHGTYDTGLFLASQFVAVADLSQKEGNHANEEYYRGLATAALAISLAAYGAMIWLFVREFFVKLRVFQTHAIPRLHHNFDCC